MPQSAQPSTNPASAAAAPTNAASARADPTSAPPRPAAAAPAQRGVLRRDSVRLVQQAALVDCSSNDAGQTLTVVPLMDGDRVAGLEVRCSCGSSTLIECVYQTENGK